MDTHKLRYALIDMIRVSLKASPKEVAFGHPCSHLIDDAVRIGIDALTAQLIDGPGEYRLNGAGLKLYVGRDGAIVSGDQYDRYPDTAPKLNAILTERGLHRHA